MITYWHIIRQNRLWRHNRNTNRSPWRCNNTHFNQRQSRPWPHAIFVEKFYNIGPGYPDTSVRNTQHDANPAVIALNNTVGKMTLPNMPRNTTGFPQPPMTRSRWHHLPSTRQRHPPHRTLSCRYTTPGSKTWVNRTNKVRNFHLILIIMNDGYVLRQFDVITEKVTQVPTQNTLYWIQKQQNTIHCFI